MTAGGHSVPAPARSGSSNCAGERCCDERGAWDLCRQPEPFAAGLDQRDAGIRQDLRQPAGDDASGGARADHDVIRTQSSQRRCSRSHSPGSFVETKPPYRPIQHAVQPATRWQATRANTKARRRRAIYRFTTMTASGQSSAFVDPVARPTPICNGVRRDRDEPAAQYGSSLDSPLGGSGFETLVPRPCEPIRSQPRVITTLSKCPRPSKWRYASFASANGNARSITGRKRCIAIARFMASKSTRLPTLIAPSVIPRPLSNKGSRPAPDKKSEMQSKLVTLQEETATS